VGYFQRLNDIFGSFKDKLTVSHIQGQNWSFNSNKSFGMNQGP